LIGKLQREISHLKDILNLKRKGGNMDVQQQLLTLKEENSQLRGMVDSGENHRLKEQNQQLIQEIQNL
jgi:RNA polymerase-binding transcription factor DksA